MNNEILIPPWIIPQAESTTLVDDSTSVFRAAYAPGNAQRVSYVEPRLQVKQTFQGLRGFERAALLAALRRAKGKLNTVRAVCGYANRGSFPATEMFANNDFSGGLTSWVTDAQYSLSALDHGIRATRAQVTSSSFPVSQSIARLVGIPYCVRGFINAGAGTSSTLQVGDNGAAAGSTPISQGMAEFAYTVPASGSQTVGFFDNAAIGELAGNYFDAKWSSLSRCAQVDNGANLLLNSDTYGAGTVWAANAATSNIGGINAPDNSGPAFYLAETTANDGHFVKQDVTVTSAAADYSLTVYVKAQNRSWAFLQLVEGTAGTPASAYFDLNSIALGTVTNGTNWSGARTTIQDAGAGWRKITITGRKTNAATLVTPLLSAATGNGVASYIGVTSPVALLYWRATLANSAVPTRPIRTTTSAAAAISQTGSALFIKGLPASTQGLLLENDSVEINGELKSVTSALDSDASGIGYLQFAPALVRSPADNDGVIINKPMGKFILAADASWDNQYGVYADINITLEAINE